MPSRGAQLFVVTLRSVIVGIVAALLATFALTLVMLTELARSTPHEPGTEVGIDLVTLVHNFPGYPLK